MSKIFVKPSEGSVVLLPRTTPFGPYPRVPDEGMWVDEDVFIYRRLHHGDLIECAAPKDMAEDQTPMALSAPAANPKAIAKIADDVAKAEATKAAEAAKAKPVTTPPPKATTGSDAS